MLWSWRQTLCWSREQEGRQVSPLCPVSILSCWISSIAELPTAKKRAGRGRGRWKSREQFSECCWKRDLCYSAWSLGRGQSGSPSLWAVHNCADVERSEGTAGSSSTETLFLSIRRVSDSASYPSLSPIFHQKVSIQRALDAFPHSPWVFPALAYQFLKLLINNSKGDPIKLVLSSWVGPASLHLSRSLPLIPTALKTQWDKKRRQTTPQIHSVCWENRDFHRCYLILWKLLLMQGQTT